MSVVRRWVFRLALASLIAIATGYLPYRAYGPEGVGRALRLEREYNDLLEQTERLKRENKVFSIRIERLKSDRRAIERVARDELGLVRENDLVFQFEGADR